jgi:starch phosphorylase
MAVCQRVKNITSNNLSAEDLKELTLFHLKYTRGKDWRTATPYDLLTAFSLGIRDLAVDLFIDTQRTYLNEDVKRIYYLSMEFLVGKFLERNLYALGVVEEARKAMDDLGIDIETLFEADVEAGLGNGGLGRLAACFLDSLASLQMPAYGYGLRYEYGIFKQELMDGWQQENPDSWLNLKYPWEMSRPEYTLPVLVYGRLEKVRTARHTEEDAWVDWQLFEGVPYDVPIIGHKVSTVNMLRLWKAQASKGFRLDVFNQGDYVNAVEDQNWAETVTKVLYPSDSTYAGKELRLIQEYFLVTCSIRDVIRRFKKNHKDWNDFPKKNAIQLNDTHPALSIPEFMRCLVDEEDLPWNTAWDITTRTFSYTNHTLLPEALERWPVDLLGKVLPRHLKLIYGINSRFLQKVEVRFPGNVDKLRNVSLVEEAPHKQVRMANLAMVGSHRINGVSALHSRLLKDHVMHDFSDIWPDKFTNVTNGITHRRWLLKCNPGLSELITEHIGDGWIHDLEQLKKLEPLANDPKIQQRFLDIKRGNKQRLADYIEQELSQPVMVDSLFDVQIKRLHMYKRQLLNALHIIHLYHQLIQDPAKDIVPRTFIFAAKAAPAYHIAKRVIKLINSMAEVINHDPLVAGRLKVVFLPDYNVTLAERIIPAADLSEQISTAGMEASGTGNMKLSLNGALTIGTWDGANIEIAQHVGEDNIFIFGHHEEELEQLRQQGYNPWDYYNNDEGLRRILDGLQNNEFDPSDRDLYKDLFNELTHSGDPFFYLADFRRYIEAQEQVAALYREPNAWAQKALLNVARMGWFSSDRSIREYAENIWDIKPVEVDIQECLYPTSNCKDQFASESLG